LEPFLWKHARMLVRIACVLVLLFAVQSATAAPTAKEKAEAKTLWTKGKKLALSKKHDEAAAAFRAAHELDPKAQYQLDLARSLADAGRLVEARQLFGEVAETQEKDAQRAKAVAAQQKKALDGRIPSIKVVVVGGGEASAIVTVNGESVEAGKDVPFDPGEYTVVARAAGGPEARDKVALAERDHKTVTLTLSAPAQAPPEDEPDEGGGGGGTMIPAAISYAVGGAGLTVGAVFGVLAFQKTSEVEELCGGKTCPGEYADDVATAQDYGTASTVAFAVGGIGVAAGLILTFTVGMSGGDDEKKESAWVVPVVGPGYAGVAGAF
jgi:hypothetical protein